MQQTKNIYLRLVEESDVDFILHLRLNQNLSKYLNVIPNNRDSQVEWISNYKALEANGLDYYFVIVDKALGDIGLVRLYDIDYFNKSFTWGSWIICDKNRPNYAALESAILSLEFAFVELGLFRANIDVRVENETADKFYSRFGMSYEYQDDINKYYSLTRSKFIQLKYTQYYKFLLM